jgi:hypothetical protein
MFKSKENKDKEGGYTAKENENYERSLSIKKSLDEMRKAIEERKKCEEDILKVKKNLMEL